MILGKKAPESSSLFFNFNVTLVRHARAFPNLDELLLLSCRWDEGKNAVRSLLINL